MYFPMMDILSTQSDICCYTSRQTYIEIKILTLREVLTKRHSVLKARQRLEQETRGLGHNLDELQIHKTDAVIV